MDKTTEELLRCTHNLIMTCNERISTLENEASFLDKCTQKEKEMKDKLLIRIRYYKSMRKHAESTLDTVRDHHFGRNQEGVR